MICARLSAFLQENFRQKMIIFVMSRRISGLHPTPQPRQRPELVRRQSSLPQIFLVVTGTTAPLVATHPRLVALTPRLFISARIAIRG